MTETDKQDNETLQTHSYLNWLLKIIPMLVIVEFAAQIIFFALGKDFKSSLRIDSLTLLVIAMIAFAGFRNISSNIKTIEFKE